MSDFPSHWSAGIGLYPYRGCSVVRSFLVDSINFICRGQNERLTIRQGAQLVMRRRYSLKVDKQKPNDTISGRHTKKDA